MTSFYAFVLPPGERRDFNDSLLNNKASDMSEIEELPLLSARKELLIELFPFSLGG